jgi:hypothetical protein
MALRLLGSALVAALAGLTAACSGGTTTYYVYGSDAGQGSDGAISSSSPTDPSEPSDPGKSCTADCDGKACGSDGCGGTCGTCSGKATCSADGDCEVGVPAGVTCPPTGPVGTTAGKIAKAGSVQLANGGSYDLRANCAKPIYLLGVTETCGICMQKLGQWSRPGNVLDQLKSDGVDVVLVSTDNSQGAPGSVSTAEALRNRFGFGTRFFIGYEPMGSSGQASFNGFIPTRTNHSGARIALILKPGNVIGAVGQVDDVSAIRAALGL